MDSKHIPCIPALLATALLAACGGGGGGGMVQPDRSVGQVVTPPPPPPPVEPCSGTLTSDCVANAEDTAYMFNGRESDHALIKQGIGRLRLEDGVFRFDGGTRVESGTIAVNESAMLVSDTLVQSGAGLEVWGQLVGDIDNQGFTALIGSVDGNFVNRGELYVDINIYGFMGASPAAVTGDYVHADDATFVSLLMDGSLPATLYVGGRADILGGTLRLEQYTDAWGPYPLPPSPSTHLILHADGGIFGTFDQWVAPTLFVTGSLRYLANDLYFDATAISAQAAMQSAGASDAITLQTAGRFDAALGGAAAMPRDAASLTSTQRRFLQSAAAIQRIGHVDQALRTFDSLSGHGHVAAVEATMAHALRAAPALSVHAKTSHGASGAWSTAPEMVALHGGAFAQGATSGYDLQLANGLRVGSSVAWTSSQLEVDRAGGFAHGTAPQWNAYLHRARPDGWHATGSLGYSHQRLALERPIDLGVATSTAHAERTLDTTYAYAEGGRDIAAAGGTVTPFAAVHATTVRGGAFAEAGDTGFELIGQASRHLRGGGDLGVRYTRQWQWDGGDRWMRMDFAARYRHLFAVDDDFQAAFAGTPGLLFDVAGLPVARNDVGWNWTFTGGATDRLAWMFRYEQREEDRGLAVGLALGF